MTKWRRKIKAVVRRLRGCNVTYVPVFVETIAKALDRYQEFRLEVYKTACGKSVDDWMVTVHNDGTVSMWILCMGGVVVTQRRLLVDSRVMAHDIVQCVKQASLCTCCGMFTFDHSITANVPFC